MQRFSDVPGARMRASVAVRSTPDGTVVVTLTGDHDLSTKPQLLEALAGVRGKKVVVIDLARCTFVDSTIIAAILGACRSSPASQSNVSVVLPPDTSYVYRALAVIGLRDLMPARLSIEAALRVHPCGWSSP
jgi:anti-anti-sigma factor